MHGALLVLWVSYCSFQELIDLPRFVDFTESINILAQRADALFLASDSAISYFDSHPYFDMKVSNLPLYHHFFHQLISPSTPVSIAFRIAERLAHALNISQFEGQFPASGFDYPDGEYSHIIVENLIEIGNISRHEIRMSDILSTNLLTDLFTVMTNNVLELFDLLTTIVRTRGAIGFNRAIQMIPVSIDNLKALPLLCELAGLSTSKCRDLFDMAQSMYGLGFERMLLRSPQMCFDKLSRQFGKAPPHNTSHAFRDSSSDQHPAHSHEELITELVVGLAAYYGVKYDHSFSEGLFSNNSYGSIAMRIRDLLSVMGIDDFYRYRRQSYLNDFNSHLNLQLDSGLTSAISRTAKNITEQQDMHDYLRGHTYLSTTDKARNFFLIIIPPFNMNSTGVLRYFTALLDHIELLLGNLYGLTDRVWIYYQAPSGVLTIPKFIINEGSRRWNTHSVFKTIFYTTKSGFLNDRVNLLTELLTQESFTSTTTKIDSSLDGIFQQMVAYLISIMRPHISCYGECTLDDITSSIVETYQGPIYTFIYSNRNHYSITYKGIRYGKILQKLRVHLFPVTLLNCGDEQDNDSWTKRVYVQACYRNDFVDVSGFNPTFVSGLFQGTNRISCSFFGASLQSTIWLPNGTLRDSIFGIANYIYNFEGRSALSGEDITLALHTDTAYLTVPCALTSNEKPCYTRYRIDTPDEISCIELDIRDSSCIVSSPSHASTPVDYRNIQFLRGYGEASLDLSGIHSSPLNIGRDTISYFSIDRIIRGQRSVLLHPFAQYTAKYYETEDRKKDYAMQPRLFLINEVNSILTPHQKAIYKTVTTSNSVQYILTGLQSARFLRKQHTVYSLQAVTEHSMLATKFMSKIQLTADRFAYLHTSVPKGACPSFLFLTPLSDRQYSSNNTGSTTRDELLLLRKLSDQLIKPRAAPLEQSCYVTHETISSILHVPDYQHSNLYIPLIQDFCMFSDRLLLNPFTFVTRITDALKSYLVDADYDKLLIQLDPYTSSILYRESSVNEDEAVNLTSLFYNSRHSVAFLDQLLRSVSKSKHVQAPSCYQGINLTKLAYDQVKLSESEASSCYSRLYGDCVSNSRYNEFLDQWLEYCLPRPKYVLDNSTLFMENMIINLTTNSLDSQLSMVNYKADSFSVYIADYIAEKAPEMLKSRVFDIDLYNIFQRAQTRIAHSPETANFSVKRLYMTFLAEDEVIDTLSTSFLSDQDLFNRLYTNETSILKQFFLHTIIDFIDRAMLPLFTRIYPPFNNDTELLDFNYTLNSTSAPHFSWKFAELSCMQITMMEVFAGQLAAFTASSSGKQSQRKVPSNHCNIPTEPASENSSYYMSKAVYSPRRHLDDTKRVVIGIQTIEYEGPNTLISDELIRNIITSTNMRSADMALVIDSFGNTIEISSTSFSSSEQNTLKGAIMDTLIAMSYFTEVSVPVTADRTIKLVTYQEGFWDISPSIAKLLCLNIVLCNDANDTYFVNRSRDTFPENLNNSEVTSRIIVANVFSKCIGSGSLLIKQLPFLDAHVILLSNFVFIPRLSCKFYTVLEQLLHLMPQHTRQKLYFMQQPDLTMYANTFIDSSESFEFMKPCLPGILHLFFGQFCQSLPQYSQGSWSLGILGTIFLLVCTIFFLRRHCYSNSSMVITNKPLFEWSGYLATQNSGAADSPQGKKRGDSAGSGGQGVLQSSIASLRSGSLKHGRIPWSPVLHTNFDTYQTLTQSTDQLTTYPPPRHHSEDGRIQNGSEHRTSSSLTDYFARNGHIGRNKSYRVGACSDSFSNYLPSNYDAISRKCVHRIGIKGAFAHAFLNTLEAANLYNCVHKTVDCITVFSAIAAPLYYPLSCRSFASNHDLIVSGLRQNTMQRLLFPNMYRYSCRAKGMSTNSILGSQRSGFRITNSSFKNEKAACPGSKQTITSLSASSTVGRVTDLLLLLLSGDLSDTVRYTYVWNNLSHNFSIDEMKILLAKSLSSIETIGSTISTISYPASSHKTANIMHPSALGTLNFGYFTSLRRSSSGALTAHSDTLASHTNSRSNCIFTGSRELPPPSETSRFRDIDALSFPNLFAETRPDRRAHSHDGEVYWPVESLSNISCLRLPQRISDCPQQRSTSLVSRLLHHEHPNGFHSIHRRPLFLRGLRQPRKGILARTATLPAYSEASSQVRLQPQTQTSYLNTMTTLRPSSSFDNQTVTRPEFSIVSSVNTTRRRTTSMFSAQSDPREKMKHLWPPSVHVGVNISRNSTISSQVHTVPESTENMRTTLSAGETDNLSRNDSTWYSTTYHSLDLETSSSTSSVNIPQQYDSSSLADCVSHDNLVFLTLSSSEDPITLGIKDVILIEDDTTIANPASASDTTFNVTNPTDSPNSLSVVSLCLSFCSLLDDRSNSFFDDSTDLSGDFSVLTPVTSQPTEVNHYDQYHNASTMFDSLVLKHKRHPLKAVDYTSSASKVSSYEHTSNSHVRNHLRGSSLRTKGVEEHMHGHETQERCLSAESPYEAVEPISIPVIRLQDYPPPDSKNSVGTGHRPPTRLTGDSSSSVLEEVKRSYCCPNFSDIGCSDQANSLKDLESGHRHSVAEALHERIISIGPCEDTSNSSPRSQRPEQCTGTPKMFRHRSKFDEVRTPFAPHHANSDAVFATAHSTQKSCHSNALKSFSRSFRSRSLCNLSQITHTRFHDSPFLSDFYSSIEPKLPSEQRVSLTNMHDANTSSVNWGTNQDDWNALSQKMPQSSIVHVQKNHLGSSDNRVRSREPENPQAIKRDAFVTIQDNYLKTPTRARSRFTSSYLQLALHKRSKSDTDASLLTLSGALHATDSFERQQRRILLSLERLITQGSNARDTASKFAASLSLNDADYRHFFKQSFAEQRAAFMRQFDLLRDSLRESPAIIDNHDDEIRTFLFDTCLDHNAIRAIEDTIMKDTLYLSANRLLAIFLLTVFGQDVSDGIMATIKNPHAYSKILNSTITTGLIRVLTATSTKAHQFLANNNYPTELSSTQSDSSIVKSTSLLLKHFPHKDSTIRTTAGSLSSDPGSSGGAIGSGVLEHQVYKILGIFTRRNLSYSQYTVAKRAYYSAASLTLRELVQVHTLRHILSPSIYRWGIRAMQTPNCFKRQQHNVSKDVLIAVQSSRTALFHTDAPIIHRTSLLQLLTNKRIADIFMQNLSISTIATLVLPTGLNLPMRESAYQPSCFATSSSATLPIQQRSPFCESEQSGFKVLKRDGFNRLFNATMRSSRRSQVRMFAILDEEKLVSPYIINRRPIEKTFVKFLPVRSPSDVSTLLFADEFPEMTTNTMDSKTPESTAPILNLGDCSALPSLPQIPVANFDENIPLPKDTALEPLFSRYFEKPDIEPLTVQPPEFRQSVSDIISSKNATSTEVPASPQDNILAPLPFPDFGLLDSGAAMLPRNDPASLRDENQLQSSLQLAPYQDTNVAEVLPIDSEFCFPVRFSPVPVSLPLLANTNPDTHSLHLVPAKPDTVVSDLRIPVLADTKPASALSNLSAVAPDMSMKPSQYSLNSVGVFSTVVPVIEQYPSASDAPTTSNDLRNQVVSDHDTFATLKPSLIVEYDSYENLPIITPVVPQSSIGEEFCSSDLMIKPISETIEGVPPLHPQNRAPLGPSINGTPVDLPDYRYTSANRALNNACDESNGILGTYRSSVSTNNSHQTCHADNKLLSHYQTCHSFEDKPPSTGNSVDTGTLPGLESQQSIPPLSQSLELPIFDSDVPLLGGSARYSANEYEPLSLPISPKLQVPSGKNPVAEISAGDDAAEELPLFLNLPLGRHTAAAGTQSIHGNSFEDSSVPLSTFMLYAEVLTLNAGISVLPRIHFTPPVDPRDFSGVYPPIPLESRPAQDIRISVVLNPYYDLLFDSIETELSSSFSGNVLSSNEPRTLLPWIAVSTILQSEVPSHKMEHLWQSGRPYRDTISFSQATHISSLVAARDACIQSPAHLRISVRIQELCKSCLSLSINNDHLIMDVLDTMPLSPLDRVSRKIATASDVMRFAYSQLLAAENKLPRNVDDEVEIAVQSAVLSGCNKLRWYKKAKDDAITTSLLKDTSSTSLLARITMLPLWAIEFSDYDRDKSLDMLNDYIYSQNHLCNNVAERTADISLDEPVRNDNHHFFVRTSLSQIDIVTLRSFVNTLVQQKQ